MKTRKRPLGLIRAESLEARATVCHLPESCRGQAASEGWAATPSLHPLSTLECPEVLAGSKIDPVCPACHFMANRLASVSGLGAWGCRAITPLGLSSELLPTP